MFLQKQVLKMAFGMSRKKMTDLDRKPRPVAQAYKNLLEQFGQITIIPYGEVFELTDRQAELKVEV